jgi:hypothetical protein
MSALDRMTKQEANKDRIRQKLEKRRAAAVMEQKGASEFVYKVPGEEGQQRSSVPPMSDEQLIAEFETGTSAKPANKKKKKAKK